jgi:CheY-like chemotaxis protein
MLDRDWATDGRVRPGTMEAMAGFKENVDSLLDFARSLSGRVDLSYSKLDFEQSLRAWIASASQGSNKRVSVHFSGFDTSIFVQRTVLFRSFQNILTNALRHAGSEVVVRAGIANGGFTLKVRIQDDGPGIPESVFVGLTDFRAIRTENGGSLGMGLLIVRALVTSVGGRLAFPECDAGAIVEIELPIRQNPAATDDVRPMRFSRPVLTSDETAKPPTAPAPRILYCEDAAEIREAFHPLLESAFRDVDQCGSVDGFRKVFSLKSYDVAVLDYNLGDGSALDVARQLKRQNSACKIIVLTGLEVRELNESPIVDRVLRKPIQFRELVRAIEGVLLHGPEGETEGSKAMSGAQSVQTTERARGGDLGASADGDGGGQHDPVATAR